VRWDLDKRKRAETGLKESEQGLCVLVETIPGHSVITSPDDEVEYVNQPTLDTIGVVLEVFRNLDWGDVAIDAEVDLGLVHDVHGLAARLNVSLPGLEWNVAQELTDGAHQICSYSRVTRGNIDVAVNVVYA